MDFNARSILKNASHALRTHILKVFLNRLKIFHTNQLFFALIVFFAKNFDLIFFSALIFILSSSPVVEYKYFDFAIAIK